MKNISDKLCGKRVAKTLHHWKSYIWIVALGESIDPKAVTGFLAQYSFGGDESIKEVMPLIES